MSAPRRRFPFPRDQRLQLLLIAGALLLVLVLVATVLVVAISARSDDAVRLPPGTPEAERPGELISSAPITAGVPDGMLGWRIRYGTSDARGAPVEATGVVLASAAGGDRPRPVLSVAHGTTGIQQACAPSLQNKFPTPPTAAVVDLVRRGWVAVQADYVGLGVEGPAGVHPYLDGTSEAHAVLDATRAARGLDGLDVSSKTVIYGNSQGGHAALFAGQEASRHAPDLSILGVVAVAPATDLRTMLGAMAGTSFGLAIDSYVAVSWDALQPEVGIPELVADWPLVRRIASRCAQPALAVASAQRGAQPVFDAADLAGPLRETLEENTPNGPIAAPVLIAQGASDQIIQPALQRAYVLTRCATGQPIDYRTFAGRTHVTISADDSPLVPQVVSWAEDRLADRPATPTCGAASPRTR